MKAAGGSGKHIVGYVECNAWCTRTILVITYNQLCVQMHMNAVIELHLEFPTKVNDTYSYHRMVLVFLFDLVSETKDQSHVLLRTCH